MSAPVRPRPRRADPAMTTRRAPASSGSPLSFARYCPIMLSDSGPWSIRPHTHEQRSALLPAAVRRLEDRFGHGLLASPCTAPMPVATTALFGSRPGRDRGGGTPAAREPGTVETMDGQFVDIPSGPRTPGPSAAGAGQRLVFQDRKEADRRYQPAGRRTGGREIAARVERAETAGDPLHSRLVALAVVGSAAWR
jgi:hypothetical protein